MRRRKFIAFLCSAAAWPVAARAQQSTLPVVGFISGVAADTGRAAYPITGSGIRGCPISELLRAADELLADFRL
jgi:hypothetical protein